MSDAVLTDDPRSVRNSPGDGAAILALVLAFVAVAFLMFISPVRACSFDGTTESCVIQWDVVSKALAVAAPGLIASAAPVVGLRSQRAVVLRTSAAVVLGTVAMTGVLLPPGLLFLPSTVAMSLSAVQAKRATPSRGRIGHVLAWVSLSLTVIAAMTLLFISSGERCVTRSGAGVGAGESGTSCSSTTLLESQGPGVIGILLVPVAIAALPVAAGRHKSARVLRAISATVLLGFALLGMLSIGLFYLPATLAMVAAASLEGGEKR
jgi:hypothetical protein